MSSQTRPFHKFRFKPGVGASLVLLVLLSSGCGGLDSSAESWRALVSQVRSPEFDVAIEDADLRLAWERSDVVTFQNDGDRDLSAGNGVAVLVGALRRGAPPELIVIEGERGKTLWQTTEGDAASVAISPTGVFLGTRSGKVQRLETATGSPVWGHQIMDLTSVAGVVVQNGTLLARSPAGAIVLLEEASGHVTMTLDLPQHDRLFWVAPDMWLSRGNGPNALIASEPDLGDTIWETQLDLEVVETPIVSGERIYVRTGTEVGTVYCINRLTGDIIWQAENSVLGNLAADGDVLYILGIDGRVQKLDGLTGKGQPIASFRPSPFPLRTDRGGYYLAFDSSNALLYVAIGDSDQLFALKANSQ